MVRGIGFLGEARAAILHHHERLDGSGYPYGLAGGRDPGVRPGGGGRRRLRRDDLHAQLPPGAAGARRRSRSWSGARARSSTRGWSRALARALDRQGWSSGRHGGPAPVAGTCRRRAGARRTALTYPRPCAASPTGRPPAGRSERSTCAVDAGPARPRGMSHAVVAEPCCAAAAWLRRARHHAVARPRTARGRPRLRAGHHGRRARSACGCPAATTADARDQRAAGRRRGARLRAARRGAAAGRPTHGVPAGRRRRRRGRARRAARPHVARGPGPDRARPRGARRARRRLRRRLLPTALQLGARWRSWRGPRARTTRSACSPSRC